MKQRSEYMKAYMREYMKEKRAKAKGSHPKPKAEEKAIEPPCKHEYRSDGGSCIHCGKTVLETLNLQKTEHAQKAPEPTKEAKIPVKYDLLFYKVHCQSQLDRFDFTEKQRKELDSMVAKDQSGEKEKLLGILKGSRPESQRCMAEYCISTDTEKRIIFGAPVHLCKKHLRLAV